MTGLSAFWIKHFLIHRSGIPKFHPGFRRRMYGRRASQLLKEIDSSEAGQLAPFNVIFASLYSPSVTSLESE